MAALEWAPAISVAVLTGCIVSLTAGHLCLELTFQCVRQQSSKTKFSCAAEAASRIRSGNLDQNGVRNRTEIFSDAVIQALTTALAPLARFPSREILTT